MNKQTLARIPSSIDQLKEELTQLDLSGNNSIKELPPSIGSLQRLTEINLQRCSLWGLPAEMANLTELKELNLIDCPQLKTIPFQFRKLKQLSSLKLS